MRNAHLDCGCISVCRGDIRVAWLLSSLTNSALDTVCSIMTSGIAVVSTIIAAVALSVLLLGIGVWLGWVAEFADFHTHTVWFDAPVSEDKEDGEDRLGEARLKHVSSESQ